MSRVSYDELAQMYQLALGDLKSLQTRIDAVRTIVGQHGGSLKTEVVFYDERGTMWTSEELDEILREHEQQQMDDDD